MNRREVFRLGGAAAATVVCVGPTFAQQKLVLKATDVHPLGYPTVEAVVRMGKKLEAASSGRLSIQMYPSMQLGGEKEMIEQAQVGALAIARISVGPMGPIVPELNVFNLPFMGIEPDRAKIAVSEGSVAPAAEPSFSREEAIRTPAFWLLMLYTMMMYPVQAGVSLHQAPHLIARGLDPTAAAFVVSGFSLMSMLATAACGFIPRRFPVRFPLALAAAMMAGGTLLLPGVVSMASGFLAAGVFGLGLGAMLTLTPIAWADYFGRANYASIRGYALSSQVLAQAAGPLLSGALYDWIGTYSVSLHCFAVLSGLGLLAALAAIPPRRAQDM